VESMRDDRSSPRAARSRIPLAGGVLAAAVFASACTSPARATDASGVDREAFAADPSVAEASDAAPCTQGDACRRTVVFAGKKFDFYASHSLMRPNPAIERVVILVHGIDGGASMNFVTLVKSARRAEESGVASRVLDGSLLIAPHFPRDAPGDHFSWGKQSWHVGDRTPGRPAVSSYEILDRLVVELTRSGRFPRLHTITLAGHSAGGQLTHRYASVSNAEDELPRGIRMRYVAANPGTYLYLRPERPYFERERRGAEGFSLPFTSDGDRAPGFRGAPRCPNQYDRYRFGLAELNAYASRAGAERIVQHATTRDVTYLIGLDDTTSLDCSAPDAPSRCDQKLARNVQDLDKSCPAELQGPDRLARARHYSAFMARYFPGHRQRLIEIAGVHHASRPMFESDEGVRALFDVR
jgi:pimeloyl-ACP methyl ester carboxylesterase